CTHHAARGAPLERGGAGALPRRGLREDHGAPRLLPGHERTRGRAAARVAAMSRRKRMLEEMGIAPLWRLRERPGQLEVHDAADGTDARARPDAVVELSARDAAGAQTEPAPREERAGGRGAGAAPAARVGAEAPHPSDPVPVSGVESEQGTRSRAAGEARSEPPSVPPAD